MNLNEKPMVEVRESDVELTTTIISIVNDYHCTNWQETIEQLITTALTPERQRVKELEKECETLMLRSVAAMAIAEADEGWENLPIDCPMLEAVVQLRKNRDERIGT